MIKKQNQTECRQHLIEMAAMVKRPENEPFQHKAAYKNADECKHEACGEMSGEGDHDGCEIGADHILHAMRQIDEIHHTENESQARSHHEH